MTHDQKVGTKRNHYKSTLTTVEIREKKENEPCIGRWNGTVDWSASECHVMACVVTNYSSSLASAAPFLLVKIKPSDSSQAGQVSNLVQYMSQK